MFEVPKEGFIEQYLSYYFKGSLGGIFSFFINKSKTP